MLPTAGPAIVRKHGPTQNHLFEGLLTVDDKRLLIQLELVQLPLSGVLYEAARVL